MGLGALGLADIFQGQGPSPPRRGAGPTRATFGREPPHFPARVKRVVHFFLNGGPSHVDTFDPKPR